MPFLLSRIESVEYPMKYYVIDVCACKNTAKSITAYSLGLTLFHYFGLYFRLALGSDGSVSANHIRSWTRYYPSHLVQIISQTFSVSFSY